MYLTSFVTTRIGVELAAVQSKLPDRVVVGLQLYSARTFHVTYTEWSWSPTTTQSGSFFCTAASSTPIRVVTKEVSTSMIYPLL